MKKFEDLLAAANIMVDICLAGDSHSNTKVAGRVSGTLAIDEDSIFVSPVEKVQISITPAVEDKVVISHGEVRTVMATVQTNSIEEHVKCVFEQMRDLLFMGWAQDGITGFNELMKAISATQGQVYKSNIYGNKAIAKMFGKLVTTDGGKRRAWKTFNQLKADEEVSKATYAAYKKIQKEVLGLC